MESNKIMEDNMNEIIQNDTDMLMKAVRGQILAEVSCSLDQPA